jgi:hypothetical protein
MDMRPIVPSTRMARRAPVWIGRVNLEGVLIHMIGVWVMQVALVQIIGMAGVGDSHVTAARAVLVSVVLMCRTSVHGDLLAERDCLILPR